MTNNLEQRQRSFPPEQSSELLNTEGAKWWRTVCQITPNIYLSGDLPHGERAMPALRSWIEDHGITHILDVREEYSDEALVAKAYPDVGYVYLGTHDNGGHQDPAWFHAGWDAYKAIIDEDPTARVMVHCHMGINRAPSMVFYLMLMEGYGTTQALTMIRNNRPIAACFYAESAWKTYCRVEPENADDDGDLLIEWFFIENEIDLHGVIHQIRQVEYL